MTLIALANYEDCNTIVTDSICMMPDRENKVKTDDDVAIRMKFELWDNDTKTYLALIGHEMVLESIHFLQIWSSLNNMKLDLYNVKHMKEVCKTAFYISSSLTNVRPEQLSGETSIVILINKERIGYWRLIYKNNNYSLDENFYTLQPNETILFYGSTPFLVKEQYNKSNVVEKLIHLMNTTHDNLKGKPSRLPYELRDCFCSIIFSKTDTTIDIKTPFNSFSSLIHGTYGYKENITVMNNSNWSPKLD